MKLMYPLMYPLIVRLYLKLLKYYEITIKGKPLTVKASEGELN
jgi:hypothetical protein